MGCILVFSKVISQVRENKKRLKKNG